MMLNILSMMGSVKGIVNNVKGKKSNSSMVEDFLGIFDKVLDLGIGINDKAKSSLEYLLCQIKTNEDYKAELNNILFKSLNKSAASARIRDLGLRQIKGHNFRADLIFLLSLANITGCGIGLVYFKELDSSTIKTLSRLIGASIAILTNFSSLEFGVGDLDNENVLGFNVFEQCFQDLCAASTQNKTEMMHLIARFKSDTKLKTMIHSEFIKLVHENRDDARLRDLKLHLKYKNNFRANLMTYFSIGSLGIALVSMTYLKPSLNSESANALNNIADCGISILKKLAAFECGDISEMSHVSFKN